MVVMDRPLVIHEHRLVPDSTVDFSVQAWRCLDCGGRYGCASECLADGCRSPGPREP